jgi:hypothetical protein
MVLKVNPTDVVSIPKDCSDKKGLACKYEVIAECSPDIQDKETEFETPLVHNDGLLDLVPRSFVLPD